MRVKFTNLYKLDTRKKINKKSQIILIKNSKFVGGTNI